MDERPLAQRLADNLMNGELEKFVRTRRAAGLPWRRVARELVEASNGQVDVTEQTLRNWYPEPVASSDSAAAS